MSKIYTPERPPIADHPIWVEIRHWFYPQLGSQNNSRFNVKPTVPSHLEKQALAITLTCVCGNQFQPFRKDRGKNTISMYVTGRGHKQDYGCCGRPLVRQYTQWLKLDLKKVQDVFVQEQLFAWNETLKK